MMATPAPLMLACLQAAVSTARLSATMEALAPLMHVIFKSVVSLQQSPALMAVRVQQTVAVCKQAAHLLR